MKISKMSDFSLLWILPIQFPVSWKSSLNVWRQAGYSWKVLQRMEDRPAIGGSFCLECPYTCTAVYIRYLKTYNPQYGKGQQFMDHIKQTYRTQKREKLGPVFRCLSTHNQHNQPRTGNIRKAKNRVQTQQIIQVDVKDQYKVDLTLSQHCLLC